MMIQLAAACRNTSVRRTTGTTSDPITSANTCPGPTDGNWSISPTIESRGVVRYRFHKRLHQQDVDHRGLVDYEQIAIKGIVSVAFKSAALGIDFQEPVDRLRLDARGLGHALGRAASVGAEE